MAHILVVDDEDSIRALIKEVLSSQGHTFDEAATGTEALERLRKTKYDVVILDRNMPVMDGIQALAVMRASPQFKNVKVLMCTSASVTKEVDEAFAAGANDYILKPLNLQALIKKVQKALGS
ncbi:MAG: response regulator [Elusimicrobia bacterium]|nr:response regulator [Elusimicrobiota bacterium]